MNKYKSSAFVLLVCNENIYTIVKTKKDGPSLDLPGGKRDAEDKSLWHTLVREFKEETGLGLPKMVYSYVEARLAQNLNVRLYFATVPLNIKNNKLFNSFTPGKECDQDMTVWNNDIENTKTFYRGFLIKFINTGLYLFNMNTTQYHYSAFVIILYYEDIYVINGITKYYYVWKLDNSIMGNNDINLWNYVYDKYPIMTESNAYLKSIELKLGTAVKTKYFYVNLNKPINIKGMKRVNIRLEYKKLSKQVQLFHRLYSALDKNEKKPYDLI